MSDNKEPIFRNMLYFLVCYIYIVSSCSYPVNAFVLNANYHLCHTNGNFHCSAYLADYHNELYISK